MMSASFRRPRALLLALCPLLILSACGGDDGESDAGQGSDSDAGSDAAAARSGSPVLDCDPAKAGPEELCACAADIVCDQIHACLDAEELADKPDSWSPHASCVQEVVEDCVEDLGDPDYLPVDFPQCVQDVADASCDDFGSFDSVSNDLPPSCEDFRALDTGLGIAI
jgi:hypothetical protein